MFGAGGGGAALRSLDLSMACESASFGSAPVMRCAKAQQAMPRAKAAGKGGGGSWESAPASKSKSMRRSASPPVPALQKQAKQAVSPTAEAHPAPQPSQVEAQGSAESLVEDLTRLPHLLDANFEKLDVDSALRPTIIKVGETWVKKAQAALLGAPTTSQMRGEEIREAKSEAFELLDALTRAGAFPVAAASLHVIVAATHTFDKSLINTVVQDNVNPICKVERSSLIMAATVHGCETATLLSAGHRARVEAQSPMLFLEAVGECSKEETGEAAVVVDPEQAEAAQPSSVGDEALGPC